MNSSRPIAPGGGRRSRPNGNLSRTTRIRPNPFSLLSNCFPGTGRPGLGISQINRVRRSNQSWPRNNCRCTTASRPPNRIVGSIRYWPRICVQSCANWSHPSSKRKVIDMQKGRFSFTLAKNPFNTLLPHLSQAKDVTLLLYLESVQCAEVGDSDVALASVRGMLNAARSIGEEPFLISQLMRLACVGATLTALERVIAQGQPSSEALRKLSQLLELEEASLQSALISAVRSERATLANVYEKIYSGELSLSELSGERKPPGFLDRTFDWWWSHQSFTTADRRRFGT